MANKPISKTAEERFAEAQQIGDRLGDFVTAEYQRGMDGRSIVQALGEEAAAIFGHNHPSELELVADMAAWFQIVVREALMHHRGECGGKVTNHGANTTHVH